MAGQVMAGPPATANEQHNARPAPLTGRAIEAPAQTTPRPTPAPRTVMTGVAAAIREIAAQHASGRLSEQEYTKQKKRLLEISFGQ